MQSTIVQFLMRESEFKRIDNFLKKITLNFFATHLIFAKLLEV